MCRNEYEIIQGRIDLNNIKMWLEGRGDMSIERKKLSRSGAYVLHI